MSKNPPKGKGYKRAVKKLYRLTSRGARRRTLQRLAMRVGRLAEDHDKRLQAWRSERLNAIPPAE